MAGLCGGVRGSEYGAGVMRREGGAEAEIEETEKRKEEARKRLGPWIWGNCC